MGGQPILNSPALKESEYCHAMVHRKEGEIIGELGMQGFSNCKFWFGKTGHHPLYSVVKSKAMSLGSCADFQASAEVQNFLQQASGHDWDPETFR